MLFSAIIMYTVENPVQPDQFPNVISSLWWAICTLTTVGYGDVYPITAVGRLFASLISLVGIGIIAIPTGIIAAGFDHAIRQTEQEEHEKHMPHVDTLEEEELLAFLRETTAETDFLLNYPEECTWTEEQERALLTGFRVNPDQLFLACYVKGRLAVTPKRSARPFTRFPPHRMPPTRVFSLRPVMLMPVAKTGRPGMARRVTDWISVPAYSLRASSSMSFVTLSSQRSSRSMRLIAAAAHTRGLNQCIPQQISVSKVQRWSFAL